MEGLRFGERLRRFREAAGLTQEELGERAGLTAQGIGALERGDRKRPYPQTVRALAAALGLSEDERTALIGAVRDHGESAADSPKSAGTASLPVLPAPLVGRDREVAAVAELLRR